MIAPPNTSPKKQIASNLKKFAEYRCLNMNMRIFRFLLGLTSLAHVSYSVHASPDQKLQLFVKDLPALIAKAQAWQVPQPDKNASIIKVSAYRSDKEYYSLGFIEPDRPEQALIGFDYQNISRFRRSDIIRINTPAKFSLANIAPSSPFGSVHSVNTGLITGIQLARMGHEDIGMKLIQKSIAQESGHHRSNFKSPANETPELMLARSCLAAALNEITTPKPDFAMIHAKIERLINDRPELKSKATQWALEGVEAAMNHHQAPSGTIDRIVDDYLMSGGVDGALNSHHDDLSPEEEALILKGFEAVPALLKQRNSKRLTNHLMQGFNNFVSHPMSAKQVVNAYLQRLANNEMGSNWLRRQQGSTPEQDAVLAWWKKAEETGEEAYVKKYTITVEKKGKLSLSNELLLITNDRYPELLPTFYRKFLNSSQYSWPVGQLIASNEDIPLPTKIKLLEEGISTNSQEHRNSALGYLSKLDRELADKYLIKIINKAPKTPEIDYWRDMDAALGSMTSRSKNIEAWQALDGLIKRGDLGMKMELIDHLAPKPDTPKEFITFYLAILDRYINDTSIRDESTDKRFSGPGAGFPHDIITMKDFIHMKWARWLKLKIEGPERGASKAEWEHYREVVSKKIQRYRNIPLSAP